MYNDIMREDKIDKIKEVLLSKSGLEMLGADTERRLQHNEDYVASRDEVLNYQKHIAFWHALGGYAGMGSNVMLGLFGGAIGMMFEGGLQTEELTDPKILVAGGAAATMTGVSMFSGYKSSVLGTKANYIGMEGGARKGAEMGKLHAEQHVHCAAVNDEIIAERVGEEIGDKLEKTLEKIAQQRSNALNSEQSPVPVLAHLESCRACAASVTPALS